jgi:integrase
MRRREKGDFGAAPTPSVTVAAANQPTAKAAISFRSLLDGWAAEKRPSAKTFYSWSRVIDQLIAFVGHNDVSRLTREDLLGWKHALISSGLRTKTIRDSKLAPLRAILQWGVDNGKLTENPALRVIVDVRAKVIERIRGFTDEEASLILKAAVKETDPVKRWIPLLCAYSGARISEVCQLRAKDILQIQDVWCMKFDPEAGSLKNENSERVVPLHPAIKDAGFLKFVNAASSGPLFPTLTVDRFENRGGSGTKVGRLHL